jgi:hypothetical protein|tara:strand:+ start:356 stop:508 length:153 start_codon:yes stop_codon:yes gene_type:complete
MGEKLLLHQVAKDYNNANIYLDFQREDLFWALVAYNVESSEMESKMPRMP